MMTNSFAMPLGLILGVSTVASYFLDMSGGYFSLVFNLIVPLLALSFLVLGNKGLTKEINYLG